MSSPDKELEQQLMEAGNRLMEPSPSVEELLPLLDHVENCLSRVEQSPSQSTQNALSPSLKALVTEQIFRHSDADVKVAVASCISEITRITAPDAPYDDEQMKEVFQLIVSSFENLFDKSSRSYAKRTSILDTVAKVRSCVVMLDLECDALIIEMFQHFFNTIRDYHPENVFSSMETIMTLVLEESEDISMELLSPLLACVKRDNEEVMHIARKLAERVLQTCGDKLKPCLTQAVKTLGISLDDYSEVIASICQDTSNHISQDDDAIDNQVAQENKPARAPLDGAIQDNSPGEVAPAEEVDLPSGKSAKSVASNGIVRDDDSLQDSSLLKQEHGADKSIAGDDGNLKKQTKKSEATIKAKASNDDLSKTGSRGRSKSKAKSSRLMKKKAATRVSTKGEGSGGSDFETKQELIKIQDEVTRDSKMKSSKHLGKKAAPGVSSDDKIQSTEDEKKEESGGASDLEVKKLKQPIMIQKEGRSDSVIKVSRRMGRRPASVISSEHKIQSPADEMKEEEKGGVSDLDIKLLKQSIKKVNSRKDNGEKTVSKHPADKKKQSQGKDVLEKAEKKPSEKTDVEEMDISPKSLNQNNDESHLDKTPKAVSKRKASGSNEKASVSVEYNETLVGTKVKVWWPIDKTFYEGVVDLFDPIKKKHKVVYTDGDEEVLNLRREKWEVVADEKRSSEGERIDYASPGASPDRPPKKKMRTAQKSTDQSHVDASPTKARVATSSKSKGAATKSGQKLHDAAKSGGKPKGGSKSGSKPEDDLVSRTKDKTPKTGSSKTADYSSKAIGKSRNDDSSTLKSSKTKEDASKSAKSKEETSKISSGKAPQNGAKSSVNGANKRKSGFLKTTESESVKVLPKTPGSKSRSSKKQRR